MDGHGYRAPAKQSAPVKVSSPGARLALREKWKSERAVTIEISRDALRQAEVALFIYLFQCVCVRFFCLPGEMGALFGSDSPTFRV